MAKAKELSESGGASGAAHEASGGAHEAPTPEAAPAPQTARTSGGKGRFKALSYMSSVRADGTDEQEVREGDVVDGDNPFVKLHPDLFERVG